MPSCLVTTHLFSAASISVPLLGYTSCWIPIPFLGQAPFWFSPPLPAVFPSHRFQSRMLLPLASVSSSPWLSYFFFFGPLFTGTSSQLVFPHWRKSTHGTVLKFPLLTASLLQLPKRELSRQVFSCQLASILRSILYFCRLLLHCCHHIPRSHNLVFFRRKRQISQNLATFKKWPLIILQLQPGTSQGN